MVKGIVSMMIRRILTELLECKVDEIKNVYVSSCQHFFGTLSSINSVKDLQITMVLWEFLISLQYIIGRCKLTVNWASSIFT